MPVQFLTPLKDAHEFKPLLTEIEERPASPAGRIMFWTLMATLIATVTWLCLAEVDVVVTARGKAVPDGQVKVVQPLDGGLVAAIKVKEGQSVKKGQVLLEIDPSTTEPELRATQKQLSLASLEIARLQATIAGRGFAYLNSTQQQLHAAGVENLQRQQAAKDKELTALQEQVNQVQAELNQNRSLLAVARERLVRYEEVENIVAKSDMETARNEVTSLDAAIVKCKAKLAELNENSHRLAEEREQLLQSFKVENLEKLAEREKIVTDLSARKTELSFKHRKQHLVAPVDGTVTELLVHTVGGVVSPAQKLLSIMPAKTPVLLEAEVSNDDIGFVKEGLPVHIKVDTYDFQKYGTIEGKLERISLDSFNDHRSGANFYRMHVRPVLNKLVVNGRREKMLAGMTGTCEICVGKRKVLDLLLYPILRDWHEGVQVR